MMNDQTLKKIWAEKYAIVPNQLKKVKEISSAATAFNVNIDAIYKINGKKIEQLISENHITLKEIDEIQSVGFSMPKDIVLNIIRCFCKGIAEERITEDIKIYDWLKETFYYERLQMGGQGGIIANTLALLGIKEVIAHTNSHPKVQAEQFLHLSNLRSFDASGKLQNAALLSREDDVPLIHWIIEFSKGDAFCIDGKTFVCPKSNRFIATYDPLNTKLAMNIHFVDYLEKNKVDYLLLSGFHSLMVENHGIQLIENAVSILEKWQNNNPNMITHLEIASTQDRAIRKAIIDNIAPLVQSAGLNEREVIDLLYITGKEDLAEQIEHETTAPHLFDALMFLKEYLRVPRIQLHMFGLYLTIQDERFPYDAEKNLRGMMTAAVVSSSKAARGVLESYSDILQTFGQDVSDVGLRELKSLAMHLDKKELLDTGIAKIGKYKISAIPTILIDKPKTLVGMGDTISSVSLLAGR